MNFLICTCVYVGNTESWSLGTRCASCEVVLGRPLRELFDKVHQNIDNKADPDFASVEQQMDAKIAELEAIAQ